MKALVYEGPTKKSWKLVDKPTIEKPTDAIIKIESTTICGTDLHILKGDVPEVEEGTILGHEGIGYIEEVGSSVKNFKKGDKVIISCITSCGNCTYCKRDIQAHCNDGGWILGHNINGTQSEFVRIPHADYSLINAPKDVKNEALLMLSDILPTGNEVGAICSKIEEGDIVAIIGCGPVGIAALLAAEVYKPRAIIMVDMDEERLKIAKETFGATHSINPVELKKQGIKFTDAIKKITEEFKEERPGLKDGVDAAIECVGIPQTFDMCQQIIAPGGRIANVGVHGAKVDLQLQDLWIKNITISTGLVSAYSTKTLLKNIEDGELKPEKLVTHEFKLNDIENAYHTFSNAATEKCIKVILNN
ncbi:zinc-dependent alcohol dehydrogenase family protein [Ascoidea rubescens DSM 1968]|uniref:Alcohol dehydrogenase n=1 Tax=Ascoidea rubescens DSM 1968 TaxID=1344418 RepID=A0A1D2VCT0_9ASCO|nr:alcohol dehydrogenase [Ascoidea rubescens DSM 1968]ODV59372.1 alcohol dehydrogenase [Ascoidea rubescens DSM 1968]